MSFFFLRSSLWWGLGGRQGKRVMQAPLELVGLGSSSSMDSFASWKINGSGMEKEEREETPLQGEDESRRSSPP